MNELTVYKIANGVRAREESFGLLIVSKTTPALSLNPDGKNVWSLIDGSNTVNDIINKVAGQYQSNSVEEKVIKLLEGFESLKLIETIR
mgnify:CR=1 FL=1